MWILVVLVEVEEEENDVDGKKKRKRKRILDGLELVAVPDSLRHPLPPPLDPTLATVLTPNPAPLLM